MNAFIWSSGSSPWFLQPLLYYAMLAAGLGLCLYLFVTLKMELRAQARRPFADQQQLHDLEDALQEVRRAVERLETDLREVERQTGMLVPPAPARSGLNLSKRTQVLRMHRAGQNGAGIAASLGLPRGEVELLIKIHRLVLEQI